MAIESQHHLSARDLDRRFRVRREVFRECLRILVENPLAATRADLDNAVLGIAGQTDLNHLLNGMALKDCLRAKCQLALRPILDIDRCPHDLGFLAGDGVNTDRRVPIGFPFPVTGQLKNYYGVIKEGLPRRLVFECP